MVVVGIAVSCDASVMQRALPNKDRLSKSTVDAAMPRARPFVLWDDKLTGFGVRVSPGGVKTYVARYRPGGGRASLAQTFTIGRHGKITAEQARSEAVKILAGTVLAADPQADRAKQRADMTVSQLCELYVAEGCGTKKPATLATDKSRIEGHIKPLLGTKRLGAVTSADIQRFQIDVTAGKSAVVAKPSKRDVRRDRAKVRAAGLAPSARAEAMAALRAIETRKRKDRAPRGGKGAASRTMGLLGAIFEFAVDRKMRPDNPVRGVARHKDKPSQRFLTPDELGRLGAALASAKAEGVNPYGIAVIALLFLTGARKSEIEGLRRSEVEPLWGCLRLADSKTGAKIIPIGPAAFVVIEAVPRLSNISPYVFPSASDPERHYVGTPRVWAKVRKMAGLESVRLHDARHTWASLAVSGGQSLPIIGAVLGHRDVKTTAQYAHLAASPVQAAVESVAGSVADAMAGRGRIGG